MKYDWEKLSQPTLNKISLVLEHILVQDEIQGRKAENGQYNLVEVLLRNGIDGVTWNECRDIIQNLINDGTIGRQGYGLTEAILIIDRESLINLHHNIWHLINDSGEQGIAQKKTYFDTETSTLFVQGQPVKIAKRKEETKPHMLLKYIFDNSRKPDEQHFYTEIADYIFGNDSYDNEKDWQIFNTACKSINERVRTATTNKISDFLDFSTGKKAYVRVKSEYL